MFNQWVRVAYINNSKMDSGSGDRVYSVNPKMELSKRICINLPSSNHGFE